MTFEESVVNSLKKLSDALAGLPITVPQLKRAEEARDAVKETKEIWEKNKRK